MATRTHVAALLVDDVLIELALYVETRDPRHVERARRMAGVFGSTVPETIARMLAPYEAVDVPSVAGDARAVGRVRREQITAAVEHELDRKRRGCPGAVQHAEHAYRRVGEQFGMGPGSVKHVIASNVGRDDGS